MNPGSREWIVRSLADWAAEARHGLALVTYKSHAARERTIRELQASISAKGLTAEILRCGEFDTKRMVDELAKSHCDVLILTDQELLLFGGVVNDEARAKESALARYWFNFSREHVTNHPGSQIWWFTPDAAARFLRGMPDLGRFFLFRQHLDEVGEHVEAELPTPGPPRQVEAVAVKPVAGALDRAKGLLARAIRAASRPEPDVVRVWVELAGPAIAAFLEAGLGREAVSAFEEVRALTGEPEASLVAAFEAEPFRDACRTMMQIGDVHERARRIPAARAAYGSASELAVKLAALEPENTTFLRDLSIFYERLADLDRPIDAARASGTAASQGGRCGWQWPMWS